MLFELATLSCPILAADHVGQAALDWVGNDDADGDLIGAWLSELGQLGRVFLLRSFPDHDWLLAERRRALLSANPFHGGTALTRLDTESYAPFPFLPPPRLGARGGLYEVRTYRLCPSGLAPTLAGWETALCSTQPYTRHLVTALYALDGAPRITHVWGFDSLEQRAQLRRQAYGAGTWPPPGAPEQIADASATIVLPLPGSPLH
ncbi:NIPSNAP family protein [Acetobacteraceae bacterium KSS8]|uniref:NIPSNAP family protein n=1 Tax=Endosaccharibacter trunci TaxID=2812733 RepID=A0ABT1WAX9_9PROT|nr:NIPSNAP family protein [Acetobacteraceae bacterium KSS8]